jgi:hypothetical protein
MLDSHGLERVQNGSLVVPGAGIASLVKSTTYLAFAGNMRGLRSRTGGSMNFLWIVVPMLALFVGCVVWLVVQYLRGLEEIEEYRKRGVCWHKEPWG